MSLKPAVYTQYYAPCSFWSAATINKKNPIQWDSGAVISLISVLNREVTEITGFPTHACLKVFQVSFWILLFKPMKVFQRIFLVSIFFIRFQLNEFSLWYWCVYVLHSAIYREQMLPIFNLYIIELKNVSFVFSYILVLTTIGTRIHW
jgi:hypothetical protein